MPWTRREWMLAAGALPIELASVGARPRQVRGRDREPDPLPPQGPPPSLPDKASFAHVNGTYLNGAASHPLPAGGLDLIRRAADADAPDAFHPSEARVRETYARLINADADEIVFVPSTQSGESFVAAALGVHERGAHVVSDELHFIGSQMMYTDMAQRGVDVTWVKMRDGRIPIDDLDRAIRPGVTRLVAVSATSFVNGFQHDLKRVCEVAHARDVPVYADLIQAVGNSPIDVHDAGVDAACAATYKWLMAPDTAFLYVRRASQARMRPPFYHHSQETTPLPTTHMYPFDEPGDAIVEGYTQRDGAAGMFSMGYAPDPAALAGLEYSLPYILDLGVASIQAHVRPLVARLKEELPQRGYPLLTPVDATSPIVTAVVRDAERLAPAFRAANVAVTTRWHHIRIGVSVFNDMADIDRLLIALPPIRSTTRPFLTDL